MVEVVETVVVVPVIACARCLGNPVDRPVKALLPRQLPMLTATSASSRDPLPSRCWRITVSLSVKAAAAFSCSTRECVAHAW